MERPPDLVLIMTDQHRHDWMGYADPQFDTPNLDALAASGIRFDAGYSAATVCVPARTSLLTGLHHHRVPEEGAGAGDGASRSLRQGFWTIARELSRHGYDTALIGRMHFDPIHSDHGFDTMRMCENTSPGSGYREDVDGHKDDYGAWLESEGRPDWRLVDPDGEGGTRPYLASVPRTFPDDAEHHSTGWIQREAVEFLRSRGSTDRPLLLVVSFPHPHAPYDPPEPYASMYDPESTILPPWDPEANDRLPEPFLGNIEHWNLRRKDADDPLTRRILTAVRGLVRHIDDAVGAILDELDLRSSLVMFTADHGDYGGHRGMLGKGPWYPFDDLVRVPLVVAGGAVRGRARRSEARVQNASFVPTCLDYAGVDVDPSLFDFPSLRPLLDADDDESWEDRPLFASFSAGYPMVLSGRHKVIYFGLTGDSVAFDLDADPGERAPLPREGPTGAVYEELHELASTDLSWEPAGPFFTGTSPDPELDPPARTSLREEEQAASPPPASAPPRG